MADSVAEKPMGEKVPRQDIINTAVNFLQNPAVQRGSLKHKQAFLKSKGLSEDEIRLACEKAAAIIDENKNFKPVNGLVQVQNRTAPSYVLPPQSSWEKFRDFANTVIIIGGISYGIFVLYKKYIIPWLSGGGGKKKPVEQSIAELDIALAASVQELRDSFNKVHADIKVLHDNQQRSPSEAPATIKQIEELKTEIASVKGLLLNRTQFASPITKAPLTPPSIPAWQLTAEASAKESDEGPQSSKGDVDIEDICLSGSGSSETELVTNNGSDSSLEMIRE